MLRVPVRGGLARVVSYANIDSVVWTAVDPSPALDHVLAFDADAGLIGAVDSRGLPVWVDLNGGAAIAPSRGKLRALASVDGTTIYGVGADGAIARFTPSGNSVFSTPLPARAIFPQLNGTVLVLGGRADGARVWRLHPPEPNVIDSMMVPGATSGTGSPLGDRVYFLSGGRTLTGVHARTFVKGEPIAFDHAVIAVAATPSGDRFYVLTDSSKVLNVVDGYQDRVAARIDLPGRPRDLRVDPFGRFVLVRGTVGDSVWVVSIGTNRVVGTVRSRWRGDLPFVAADGAIAVIDGPDVAFINSGSLVPARRAAGGAADFWYPFVWSGIAAPCRGARYASGLPDGQRHDARPGCATGPRFDIRRPARAVAGFGEGRVHNLVRGAAQRGEGARAGGEDHRQRATGARRHERHRGHGRLSRGARTISDA